MGIALLPASKVADISRAQRLNDSVGAVVSIGFHVCWKSTQVQRPSFGTAMKAFQSNKSVFRPDGTSMQKTDFTTLFEKRALVTLVSDF
jgi:hypothetical protein